MLPGNSHSVRALRMRPWQTACTFDAGSALPPEERVGPEPAAIHSISPETVDLADLEARGDGSDPQRACEEPGAERQSSAEEELRDARMSADRARHEEVQSLAERYKGRSR